MSGDRYEIDEICPGVVGVKLGANTWYLDDDQPEARAIRQQSSDIELLRAELADMTEQRDAWRRRAEESEPHLTAKSPGVAGLAQLGRNAIERVTELERELAERTAMIARAIGSDERAQIGDVLSRLHSLLADRDKLCAELSRERQTSAALRRDLADPPPDVQELALKRCGHFEIVERLRTDLAAAVAITATRDETIAELELRLRISRQSNKELRESAEQAEARLAAIYNAPTVAWQDTHEPQDLYMRRPDPAQLSTRELIARPTKDQP